MKSLEDPGDLFKHWIAKNEVHEVADILFGGFETIFFVMYGFT